MVEESNKLEEKIEQCPLIGYCVVKLSDEEVCKGVKKDFKDCGVNIHYAEEDYRYHNPKIKI